MANKKAPPAGHKFMGKAMRASLASRHASAPPARAARKHCKNVARSINRKLVEVTKPKHDEERASSLARVIQDTKAVINVLNAEAFNERVDLEDALGADAVAALHGDEHEDFKARFGRGAMRAVSMALDGYGEDLFTWVQRLISLGPGITAFPHHVYVANSILQNRCPKTVQHEGLAAADKKKAEASAAKRQKRKSKAPVKNTAPDAVAPEPKKPRAPKKAGAVPAPTKRRRLTVGEDDDDEEEEEESDGEGTLDDE